MNQTAIHRIVIKIVIAVIISAIATPEVASAIDPNSSGDLGVSVFVAESPDFIREWVNTPSSFGPTIHRIQKVRFNQKVHAGFIVTGYTREANSHVNLTVDVKVTDPNGKVILEKKNWARHNKQVLGERGFILADPVLDIMIESGDPAGKYRIEAMAHDLVAGKSTLGYWELDVKH